MTGGREEEEGEREGRKEGREGKKRKLKAKRAKSRDARVLRERPHDLNSPGAAVQRYGRQTVGTYVMHAISLARENAARVSTREKRGQGWRERRPPSIPGCSKHQRVCNGISPAGSLLGG